jgi:hypothetical protein
MFRAGSQTSMDSQTYSVKDVLEECTKRKSINKYLLTNVPICYCSILLTF